jgi:hypothetical protein
MDRSRRTQSTLTERYRLAQAGKIIRQLEQIAFSGKTKNRRSKLMKAGC